MPREQYVRPPLVAREPASRQVVVWRVRLIGAILALATLLAFLWLFLTFSGVTNGEDPGLGGLHGPSGTLSSALVPRGLAGSSTS